MPHDIPQAAMAGHAVRYRGKWLTIPEAGTLANKQAGQGHPSRALELYDLILSKIPDSAQAHLNRGQTLMRLHRPEEALTSYARAIKLQPAFAEAYAFRSSLLDALKRPTEALADCEAALALRPDHAGYLNVRGSLLQKLGRYVEALVTYRRAIALRPNFADSYCNAGAVSVKLGQMVEAEQMFREALRLKPDMARALVSLAHIRKYDDPANPDIRAMQALVDKDVIPPSDMEFLCFGLGKIYDDCGRYDQAFEAYRRANQVCASTVHYDPQAEEELTHRLIQVFDREFFRQGLVRGSQDGTPIFVVGMPRSGTTLLASILSNHPVIGSAGELPTINQFTLRLPQMIGGGEPYPTAAALMDVATAGALASEYLTRLRRDCPPTDKYVIDKEPINFRSLGLIAMLFPKARIVHCLRDPLDTGLSNYFQRFTAYYSYSFDLHNIGHFYRLYARLMEHWRKVLPLQMMEVSYEDMVGDTEQLAHRLLDWLGLEWSDRCLTPHTNTHAVETASQWQVRQPIYHHSIGRWRHYEKHLGPLIEMLGKKEPGS